MSLLEKASLIITPNSYKESKLYSVIPNTTLGDMDVVRATTATRVNEQGLIEVVPRNLVKYSEDLTNPSWTNFNIIVDSNSINSPNGTLTADKISASAFNGNHLIHNTPEFLSQGNYCFSIYVKAGGVTKIAMRESWSVGYYASFDLSNGTIIDSSSNQINTITNIGNGWFRITSSRSFFGEIVLGLIPLQNSYTGGNPLLPYLGNGTDGVYVWGAQVEQGSTATTYFSTTDRLNIPRIDYTNGSCPSLLVEPQRTNLATYSEEFDNVSWSKYIGSISPNTIISPNGILNADKFIDSTDNNIHSLYKAFPIIGDTTFSFYVKIAEYTKIAFSNLSDGGLAKFDILNETIISTDSQWKNSVIKSVGNGWYRISSTTNGISGGKAVGVTLINNLNQDTFAGTGTSGIYVWGAQVEVGLYATSYIPTVASSVTRNADVISKTGISSLIGQTEGTLFLDFDFNYSDSSTQVLLKASQSNDSNSVGIEIQNNLLKALVNSSGSNIANLSNTISIGKIKCAIAYKSNDMVFYVNGSLVDTDTSGTINFGGNVDMLTIGHFNLLGSLYFQSSRLFNSTQVYKTRLTNTELSQLTTI